MFGLGSDGRRGWQITLRHAKTGEVDEAVKR